MKKIKFILISALSALTLASCSLFSDADIKIENHFNSKEKASEEEKPEATAGGVGSTTITIGSTETLLFKSIVYSNKEEGGVKKIENTYTTGNEFKYNVNGGNDYEVNPSNNNFDLYVPKGLDKTANHNVVLFIHGGAWISGVKTHVNPYVKEFAKRGYIAATLEYTLLKESMDDASLSVFRDLDEIDACISTMKSCLIQLGFVGNISLVIGGASSGAHLAMLYTYSRGDESELPIKFVIDAVGPTDIKEDVWKKFKVASEEALNSELEYSYISTHASNLEELPVSGRDYGWNEYQTARIANGMCGLPFEVSQIASSSSDEIHIDNANAASNSMKEAGGGEDLLSVTYHIKSDDTPIICAYAGMDSVVGIAQYAYLEQALVDNSVEHEYVYFRTAGHMNLDKPEEQAAYTDFINKIVNWLETK